jgi:glycosyltransferase involved in cell wall biosynthesis
MEKGEDYSFPSILVLMAALNEEQGVGLTITEFKQHLRNAQFLVVDGNSEDRTVHVAKSLGADVIYQEGSGKGDAIDSAIRHVDKKFEYVVLTDADFTYPAVFIPQMIKILEENPQVGMVCGNRFNSHFHLDAMGDRFYFGNRIIAFAHNMLNGFELRDPLTGLRVVRWGILNGWRPKSDGFDVEVELNHHVEKQGYKIVEIPISYRPRVGQKKLKLRHGIVILRRILLENIF